MVIRERISQVVEEDSAEVSDVSVDEAVQQLGATLARMEHIYEISSERMLDLVQRGERDDTAEIALWMIQYRDYQQLLAA
jgi:hypothetical protein